MSNTLQLKRYQYRFLQGNVVAVNGGTLTMSVSPIIPQVASQPIAEITEPASVERLEELARELSEARVQFWQAAARLDQDDPKLAALREQESRLSRRLADMAARLKQQIEAKEQPR